jgi:hypothetical protein
MTRSRRATSSSCAWKDRRAALACARCFHPTSRHHGQRPRQRRRLHHRRSLQRRQPRLRGRHVTPEAFVGGPIAVIKNGDPITIDAEKRSITLGIPAKLNSKIPSRQVEAAEASLHAWCAGEVCEAHQRCQPRGGDGFGAVLNVVVGIGGGAESCIAVSKKIYTSVKQ